MAINSSRFLRATIVNQNVSIVEYKPERILYDSPFPVAATILDLAKLHMYYHYYDVLKPTFAPDKVSLIMSDTDSIVFSVNCRNFFSKYKKLSFFEFSNFKTNEIVHSNENLKALLFSKMKILVIL